jgi:hypothetical protein
MNSTESRSFAARLADLLRNEQHAMADFLVALASFDECRGWIALGYANLFDFLVRELGLSRGTAHYRKTAAHLIQRYPEVLEALRQGNLCMSSIVELARVISPENRAEVLPRFFRCSKQEAKDISAELAPRPVVPRRDVVTEVRLSASPAPTVSATADGDAPTAASAEVSSPKVHPVGLSPSRVGTDSLAFEPQVSPPRRVTVEPLTATESRLHITVSRPFLKKLEAARLALSHSMPGGDAEDILSAGLDLLLARDAKNKALVEKPRATPETAPESSDPDHVPAAVRREVWERDGGCCQWALDSGGVCGSRLRVQLDHVIPKASDGKSVTWNLRLLCERHNKWAARQKLGHRLMNRYCRDPREPALPGAATDDRGLSGTDVTAGRGHCCASEGSGPTAESYLPRPVGLAPARFTPRPRPSRAAPPAPARPAPSPASGRRRGGGRGGRGCRPR